MIDLKQRAIRFARQQAKRLLAVSIIVGIFLLAQLPILSTTE